MKAMAFYVLMAMLNLFLMGTLVVACLDMAGRPG